MQCRQLTDARAAFPWLAEGSIIVQQQALRDFHGSTRRGQAVGKIPATFTSQRCHVCGHVAAESRKSQALFACVACAGGIPP